MSIETCFTAQDKFALMALPTIRTTWYEATDVQVVDSVESALKQMDDTKAKHGFLTIILVSATMPAKRAGVL